MRIGIGRKILGDGSIRPENAFEECHHGIVIRLALEHYDTLSRLPMPLAMQYQSPPKAVSAFP